MTQNAARSARTEGLIIRLRQFLRSQEPPIKAPAFYKVLTEDYLHPSEWPALGTITKFCYGDGTLADNQRPNGTINSEVALAMLDFLADREKTSTKKKS